MTSESFHDGAGLSVRDAARQLGISESGVRKALAAGRLDGAQVGRRWIVSAASVERYQSLQVAHAPAGQDANGNAPAPLPHGHVVDALEAMAGQLAAAIERAVLAERRADEAEARLRALEAGGSQDQGGGLESPPAPPGGADEAPAGAAVPWWRRLLGGG